MTARQPRRTRRRTAPGTTLPRPAAVATAPESEEQVLPLPREARASRTQIHHREHHVTTDYSHVHKDLITVLVIGIIVLSFIIGMSFIL